MQEIFRIFVSDNLKVLHPTARCFFRLVGGVLQLFVGGGKGDTGLNLSAVLLSTMEEQKQSQKCQQDVSPYTELINRIHIIKQFSSDHKEVFEVQEFQYEEKLVWASDRKNKISKYSAEVNYLGKVFKVSGYSKRKEARDSLAALLVIHWRP